jgi:hypothetical protein
LVVVLMPFLSAASLVLDVPESYIRGRCSTGYDPVKQEKYCNDLPEAGNSLVELCF